MLRLNRARIENFRSIEMLELPLHPQLTIIIGDNATGKTAILDAIAAALAPLTHDFSSRRAAEVTIDDFRLSGDLFGDPTPADEMSIQLKSGLGDIQAYYRLDTKHVDRPRIFPDFDPYVRREFMRLLEPDRTAPVLAYYREDRAYRPRGDRPSKVVRSMRKDRRGAYTAAFAAKLVYEEALTWFEQMEGAELREQRDRGDSYRDGRLDAVRRAVTRIIPEISEPRMTGLPARLAVNLALDGQKSKLLSIDQLSSGFRVMLTLTMDIARRMADLNPHLPDPLETPGVVLIDEIDLHLHPRWQQLVVHGLTEAFPNVQFILTTHSPQVLTTASSENIVKLSWSDGQLCVGPLPSSDGAESGRMLAAMGVNERPPASVSEFVERLEAYLPVLKAGRADSPAGRELFGQMQQLSPDDPILATLELEKRRLAVRQRY